MPNRIKCFLEVDKASVYFGIILVDMFLFLSLYSSLCLLLEDIAPAVPLPLFPLAFAGNYSKETFVITRFSCGQRCFPSGAVHSGLHGLVGAHLVILSVLVNENGQTIISYLTQSNMVKPL